MADDVSAPGGERTTAITPPSRAANGRKVTGILALLVSVVPLSVYAYNIERNVHARTVLEESCRDVRAELDTRLSPELAQTLFEDDTPLVLAAVHESVDRPCAEAAARLSFWRWNLRAKYSVPRDPANVTRLAAALDRAKVRCPHIMEQAFEELPGHIDPARSAQHAAAACAPLDQLARELTFMPEEQYTAWQWTSRMAAVALTLKSDTSPLPTQPRAE